MCVRFSNFTVNQFNVNFNASGNSKTPFSWAGFPQDSDHIILGTHPYFAFDGNSNTEPIATGTGLQALRWNLVPDCL